MQFVLNTSFDPHWCALFSEAGELVAESHWNTPREDGPKIWEFLQTHLKPETQLTFIGGVSGPGSFSSLRTTGTTLNALAFKFVLPMHQVRADQAITDYLALEEREQESFLLNSFSQRVFWPQNGQLKVVDLSEERLPPNQPFITSWLPESKCAEINQSRDADPLGPQKTLLTTLKNTEPQPQFVPDYEYPPVQS